MIGSATPCPAEPGFRPLRTPLSNFQFGPARPAAVPASVHHRTYPQIESKPDPRRKAVAMTLPRSLRERLRALAPDDKELGLFLEDLALAVRADTGSGYDLSDSEAFAAGLPLEPKAGPPAHMRALVHDFHRRQRQASMLVAVCIAASFVLTVVCIAALVSLIKPAPADAEPAAKSSNSVVLQDDTEGASLTLAKAGPLAERLPVEEEEPASPVTDHGTAPTVNAAPQLILVQAGRPLELSPLLAQRNARYVLFRGLPEEAKLSAGQRNPSGAWLVKDKDLDRLTLSMGDKARGEYPIEVYALGAVSAPQARQRLVFRVAAGPTGGVATGASGTLFNMALVGMAEEAPPNASKASLLMTRAMRLLGEGDIAGARLLFMHLAEQGESEAAYELARTFDGEVLSELGVKGVGADRTRAVGWYERASETGNEKAAERLKILASLSD
jgi:hypothetical protein